jgi:hypothetical protein
MLTLQFATRSCWVVQDGAVQGGTSGGSQPENALLELQNEFKQYKRESEQNICHLKAELATIKTCMFQVYSVCLGPHPPTAMLQVCMPCAVATILSPIMPLIVSRPDKQQ